MLISDTLQDHLYRREDLLESWLAAEFPLVLAGHYSEHVLDGIESAVPDQDLAPFFAYVSPTDGIFLFFAFWFLVFWFTNRPALT